MACTCLLVSPRWLAHECRLSGYAPFCVLPNDSVIVSSLLPRFVAAGEGGADSSRLNWPGGLLLPPCQFPPHRTGILHRQTAELESFCCHLANPLHIAQAFYTGKDVKGRGKQLV